MEAHTASRRADSFANDAERASTGSGIIVYNLFPLLAGSIDRWADHLPRIALMGFDWVYVNPFHRTGGSRSLYAVADDTLLDDRFRPEGAAAEPEADDALIAEFCAAAARHGLRVMTDLVINHAANDGVLAQAHPEWFRRDPGGGLYAPRAVDPDDPAKVTIWGDLAEFDYEDDEARQALAAYWQGYVARLQGLGIGGFRCDAAYQVPATVWRDLIDAAKARDPGCLFAAETLGCSVEQTAETGSAGFDYLFNSVKWWDFKADWLLDQYNAFRLFAPSIGFPENHDTARLAADLAHLDPEPRERRLKAAWLFAASFSAGVLMPMGYEFGFRRRLHVVETSPEDWEDDSLHDLSDFIGAVNRMRREVPALNVEGEMLRLSAPDDPHVALLRLDGGHPVSATDAALILVNPTARDLAVPCDRLLMGAGGRFQGFTDVTPNTTRVPFHADGHLTLEPWEVRVFRAEPVPEPAPGPEREPSAEAARVMVERVTPCLDGGRHPIKRVVGDVLRVEADIFTDGHEKIGGRLLLRPVDARKWAEAPMRFLENDRWVAELPLTRPGRHVYMVEAWRDLMASWRDEVTKKRAAGQKTALETIEGLRLVERAHAEAKGADRKALEALLAEINALPESDDAGRLDILLAHHNKDLLDRTGPRAHVSRLPDVLPLTVDRHAARFSAWYEIFPRSAVGDAATHGTFRDVIGLMPYIRGLGFDVLYFTPIHPIGETKRKGRNNSVTAAPGDVGSVYAIGADAGGHDAVHPDLGSLEDFRAMLAAAHAHGLEIALDFPIQCSPDHPWIKSHPEWFDWRPDGTLKHVENPPKKYEDIVNVHFYGGAFPSLWKELRDVVLFWIKQGVRIFRVDNPHTKPLPFWEWMIREVTDRHPDVIFLSEAFTKPKMMRMLAKVGFQQSYTYFTWRNTKAELAEYLTELAHGEMAEYYRPNFFANTPDINPVYLQTSGRPGYVVRATLAATLSSIWGIYNGFELCEGTPLPGKEEYRDSEKYELKAWDYDRPGNIRDHVTALNRIRRANPALWDFRGVLFLNAWNDHILAYARYTPSRDNLILVLVNLDPRHPQDCDFEIPLWEFNLPDHASIGAEDLLSGSRFTLTGKVQHAWLNPETNPVQIWRLIPPGEYSGSTA